MPGKETRVTTIVATQRTGDKDAAWYYAEPKDAAAKIKDDVAFWKGVKVEE